MWNFIGGVFVGVIFGYFIACLMVAASRGGREYDAVDNYKQAEAAYKCQRRMTQEEIDNGYRLL